MSKQDYERLSPPGTMVGLREPEHFGIERLDLLLPTAT
jgi:hypothetical protein